MLHESQRCSNQALHPEACPDFHGGLCRDGESHNLSWNCGEEGETTNPAVLRLRGRQMRNMAAALLLSHGVPMVQMGDEYGHTKVVFPLFLCHTLLHLDGLHQRADGSCSGIDA